MFYNEVHTRNNNDRIKLDSLFQTYEEEERMLKSDALLYSIRFIKDGKLRQKYNMNVSHAVDEVRRDHLFEAKNVDEFIQRYNSRKGSLPFEVWNKSPFEILEESVKNVQSARNVIMNLIRAQTSPTSLALAKALKREGKTFDYLLDKYTEQIYAGSKFSELDMDKKSRVYMKVIERAGLPSSNFNLLSHFVSWTFKGIIVATYANAIYNIYTADDKIDEAEHQGSIIAGAEAGMRFGGGLMPEVCAPAGVAAGVGYFVCVAAGVFVSSMVGAFLGSRAYRWTVSN